MRSVNKLWEHREWLPPDEAATYLSSKIGSPVTEADIFRLALEGHLPLSVHLPASVTGTCQEADGGPRRRSIQGLWELSMDGAGRVEIESRYHWLRGLPYIHIDGRTGATVNRDGVVCELPPDAGASGISPRPASALPSGCIVVLRTEALASFARRSSLAPPDVANPSQLEKTLGERERSTLLVIIAALAEAAEVDLSRPSKASGTIEAMTIKIGARVAPRTIEDHLKRIPEAKERHGNPSD